MINDDEEEEARGNDVQKKEMKCIKALKRDVPVKCIREWSVFCEQTSKLAFFRSFLFLLAFLGDQYHSFQRVLVRDEEEVGRARH